MRENLDSKIRRVFGPVAINKKISNNASIARIPRFISEYLISYKCGDKQDASCISSLSRYIAELYPEPSQRDLFLSKLKEDGQLKLLDEFKVRVDLKNKRAGVIVPPA